MFPGREGDSVGAGSRPGYLVNWRRLFLICSAVHQWWTPSDAGSDANTIEAAVAEPRVLRTDTSLRFLLQRRADTAYGVFLVRGRDSARIGRRWRLLSWPCAILVGMRVSLLIVALSLVVAACAPSATTETTDPVTVQPTVDVSSSPSTTSTPESGVSTSTTSSLTTTTTLPPEDIVAGRSYAVVAEKQSRRLAFIDPNGLCSGDGEVCELVPVRTVDLPDRPHNITSVGSIVYATHPGAGSMSRIDVVTGEVLTSKVGIEPHDVKYDSLSGALVVADEEGRKLLWLDQATMAVTNVVELPGKPHDLVVSNGVLWVTMIASGDLVRITDDVVEFLPTGGLPHDLIVDTDGLVWFSNWGSDRLSIFDPIVGITPDAPTGVGEPQHFAIASDGVVWISDIAGDAVVGFTAGRPTTVAVGASPHHVAFAGDTLVVAVSGTGQAVFVNDGIVVARAQLTIGLHGVTIVELSVPLGP